MLDGVKIDGAGSGPAVSPAVEFSVHTDFNMTAKAGHALIAKIFSMPQYGDGLTLAPYSNFVNAFSANQEREAALINRTLNPDNPKQVLPGYFMATATKGDQVLSVATCSLAPRPAADGTLSWNIIVGYAAVDKNDPNFVKEFARRAKSGEDCLSIETVKKVIAAATDYCEKNYGVKPQLASCEAAFESHKLWGSKLDGSGMIVMKHSDGTLHPFNYMSPPFDWDRCGNPSVESRMITNRKGEQVSSDTFISTRNIMIDGKPVSMPCVTEVYGVKPISFDKSNPDRQAVVNSVEAFIYTYFTLEKSDFLAINAEKAGPAVQKRLSKLYPESSEEERGELLNKILDRMAERAHGKHMKYIDGLVESFRQELSLGEMQIMNVKELTASRRRAA